GHAVLCAKQHVGDHPFACLLGDDLIDRRDPLLQRMIEVRNTFGGSVIALMEVPKEQVSLYGVATIEATGQEDVVKVVDLVEKPPVEEAPSNWAIIGRYVLDPEIFAVLENTPPGRGNEIQLTDALRTLAGRGSDQGGPVHGVLFRGRRYDTGDKLDYLRTAVKFAAERPDLAPALLPWLRELLDEVGCRAPGRPPGHGAPPRPAGPPPRAGARRAARRTGHLSGAAAAVRQLRHGRICRTSERHRRGARHAARDRRRGRRGRRPAGRRPRPRRAHHDRRPDARGRRHRGARRAD